MTLKTQIQKLHLKIDELPPKSAQELRTQLWQATEHLNEGMFTEAEEIRETVVKKLEYLLANCTPISY